jgi:radical SAM protein with 4Fe4S-binding SPASM domain
MDDPRRFSPDDEQNPRPVHVVWELTMKCDHACAHCGSRAAQARPDELRGEALFAVARQLAAAGSREVTLIGGEAYLHPDCLPLVGLLHRLGLRVTMQTGGRAITPALAQALKAQGLHSMGISIDGLAPVHDRLRASPGSHRAAMAAVVAARQAGLLVSANTQVNRLNADQLPALAEELRQGGVLAWRVQLTVPMGRAADHPDWILEPWRILDVIDTLGELKAEAARRCRDAGRPITEMFNIMASNNIGYYGPWETVLRSRPGGPAWQWRGCQAGRTVLGIESDGTAKACPSLPTLPYASGTLREQPLEDIWEGSAAMRFARDRDASELWGFCATCEHAETCRGGCSFTAHCTLGRRGNNPFCYHRAAALRDQGRRERLVPVEAAGGKPYDYGRFTIVEEPWSDGS